MSSVIVVGSFGLALRVATQCYPKTAQVTANRPASARLLAVATAGRLAATYTTSGDTTFRRKDGGDNDSDGPGRNAERSFHKETRSNETHASTTDPEARLYKKGDGQPARLCYMGHALMENRHGLVVGGQVSQASGTAERDVALTLIDRHRGRRSRRITLGADKAYDVTAFVQELKSRHVSAHVAIDGHLSKTGKPRKTAIDQRTLRHPGYAISQRCRKRIEEVFGWIKGSAGMAKIKLSGCGRVNTAFTMALAAYNLVRLPKLLGA